MNDPDRSEPEGEDPLGEMFRALFGGQPGGPGTPGMPALPEGFELPEGLANLPGMPKDPAALQAMFAQVQQMLAASGDDPVNWDLARDMARQAVAQDGDPSVSETEQRQVSEALRTAELWLDRATDLQSATVRTHAWSRAEWVEQTLPVWKGVVTPIATSVGDAMAQAMSTQAPPELAPMLSGVLPMMRKMGGAFFGAQVGQALGTLAHEVVGGGDIGIPLLPAGQAALLPANVAAFGEGLGLPPDEVRLYLALREAAHARLFAGVPWLRAHLLAAVEEYARGIEVDTERIEAAVREIDPSDAEALQNALSSGLFEPERTPAQQAALNRLETALALVEGWVDEVSATATLPHLPHAVALREMIRRRRAAGGPAEQMFATLVGLELRPRRSRDAAALWAEITRAGGPAVRDAVWGHPDLLPTAEDLDDPAGYQMRRDASAESHLDLDRALAEIFGEEPPATTP